MIDKIHLVDRVYYKCINVFYQYNISYKCNLLKFSLKFKPQMKPNIKRTHVLNFSF